MKKDDALWKFPDGSQLSRTVLEEMGISSGNTRQIMLQLYQGRTAEIVNNMGVKGSQLLGDRAADENGNLAAEERRQEQQRMDLAQQQEKSYAEMTWQEKKDFDQKMIEKRAEDEKANANIIGVPMGLAGFGLGLGLTGTALNSVGGALSGSVAAMNSSMMVTSNNGGGMLAMARGAFDILGPGNDKDIRIDGPNRTAAFTPGAPPPAMDMNSPLNPLNPNSPMNKNVFAMGPAGPGMTPPGMG